MYLDNSLLVNKKKLEGIEKDITCPICQGIINNPYFCIQCQNNFCCKCIKKWEQNNKNCPFRCNNPKYTSNRFLNNIFSELLKFKCQKGCDEVISYNDINSHYENCNKEDFKSKYYESLTQVEILKVQIENYNDIKNELEETQERKEELENELEETKEKKEELENELEEVKEGKRYLEDKIDELEERINELENKLESDDNYRLRNQQKDILKDDEDLKIELKNEKEKNQILESKINLFEEEKIAFKEMETKLEDENNILNKENKSLKDLIRKLIKKKRKRK